jgi:hypothetical protein
VSNKDARSKADILQGTLDLMVLQSWMVGIIHTLVHGRA